MYQYLPPGPNYHELQEKWAELRNDEKQDEKSQQKLSVLPLIILLIISITVLFYPVCLGEDHVISKGEIETLEEVPIEHGKILISPNADCFAPFTVISEAGKNYCIQLSTKDGEIVLKAYFEGGKEFKTFVPCGEYYVTYAYGDTWYGAERLFGNLTMFERGRNPLVFYFDGLQFQGHILKLTKVIDGNFPTMPARGL